MTALGVFDSGYGGLTVLRAIHARMPELSTLYLGDNARAPYGERGEEEIFRFTLQGVRFLFARGAPLVIVACNTASAGALRRIQQEILPREFPDQPSPKGYGGQARRVLGVVRPYAEAAVRSSRNWRIGVLGTAATVASGAYSRELENAKTDFGRPGIGRSMSVHVTEVAIPRLAGLIEEGRGDGPEAEAAVSAAMGELAAADSGIDTILLACTHFPLARPLFDRHRPPGAVILDQAPVVAEKLADYLARHPEMAARLEMKGFRGYATTAEPAAVSGLATRFYGAPIRFERATF